MREDRLDRLPPDVLQGVLEVAVGIEPVDDRLADYREQPDGMPDASLAARFLENLPGDDEGLDAPLGALCPYQHNAPYEHEFVMHSIQRKPPAPSAFSFHALCIIPVIAL